MRLDVALVGLLGLVGLLDDDIGLLEARLDIAMAVFGDLDEVRGLGGLGLDAFGEDVVMKERRVGLQRLIGSVTCGST